MHDHPESEHVVKKSVTCNSVSTPSSTFNLVQLSRTSRPLILSNQSCEIALMMEEMGCAKPMTNPMTAACNSHRSIVEEHFSSRKPNLLYFELLSCQHFKSKGVVRTTNSLMHLVNRQLQHPERHLVIMSDYGNKVWNNDAWLNLEDESSYPCVYSFIVFIQIFTCDFAD